MLSRAAVPPPISITTLFRGASLLRPTMSCYFRLGKVRFGGMLTSRNHAPSSRIGADKNATFRKPGALVVGVDILTEWRQQVGMA